MTRQYLFLENRRVVTFKQKIMAWYDLDDRKETKKEYLARVKYEELICKKANSFMDIVDGELKEGVQYRIITEHGFNAITVIDYVAKFHELTEIYIAVYRMNQQSVNRLTEFIDNENIRCNIILSSFFRQNKKYEKWSKDLIAYSENKKNVSIVFAWNHAKVFLAKTKDERHIVFEGSGNLSDNARIEQYLIEDCKTTYEFHKNWIDNILNLK